MEMFSNKNGDGLSLCKLTIAFCVGLCTIFGCTDRTVQLLQTTPSAANKILPASFRVPQEARNVSLYVNYRRDQAVFLRFTADSSARQKWMESLSNAVQCRFTELRGDLIGVQATLTQAPAWFTPDFDACIFFESEQSLNKKWMLIGIDTISDSVYFVCYSL